MNHVIETEVDGQVVRGHIVVLYPRALSVEMVHPFEPGCPLSCYADPIPLAEAQAGRVYCRDGQLTPLGVSAAKKVLRRQYLAAKRSRDE